MPFASRIHDYRKRRHRAALRRRGAGTWKPSCECRGAHGTLVFPVRSATDGALDPTLVLDMIARRLSTYPGVRGILFVHKDCLIELAIVAPPPMTAPLKLLVATWREEIRALCPAVAWRLRVAAAPPRNPDTYRCLFWHER